jgi:diacylglycerol kinase family enzyme
MEIASLADASTTTALNVIWNSFTSDWREAPSVRIVPASSLMIDREEEGPIPVIVDGESMNLEGPLHVTYHEDGAQCLTPG